MKVKAIKKREKRKIKQIELFETADFNEIIKVGESVDFLIHAIFNEQSTVKSSDAELTRTITFEFIKPNIRADFLLKVAVNSKLRLRLLLKVVAPEGIVGIQSKLEMRALILHPEGSITFVPMLEIDEEDVSVDHKSTIGAPDSEWLAYLESRGISLNEAKKLIVEGF